MERWAACSCCWLWTDVETWTSSPRSWSPRSFKQWCVVLCLSYAVISTISFLPSSGKSPAPFGPDEIWRQQKPRRRTQFNHQTHKQAGSLAAVLYTGWQMCMYINLCASSLYHISHVLNFSHTLPGTQFDLCNGINAALMWCHTSHMVFHVYHFFSFLISGQLKIVRQSYYQNYQI